MGAYVSKQIFQPPIVPRGPTTAPLHRIDADGTLVPLDKQPVSQPQGTSCWSPTGTGTVLSAHGDKDAKTLLIYFHGNAEDLGACEATVDRLAGRFSARAWAPEYPGYGVLRHCDGASQAAFYAMADRLADALVAHLQTAAFTHVMFVGYSLGCAVATRAVLRYDERRNEVGLPLADPMLVALAPFTSAFATKIPNADRSVFLRQLDYFCSTCMLEHASADVPLLVMHGTADEVVPISLGQNFFDIAKGPKLFERVEGAGHTNLLSAESEARMVTKVGELRQKSEAAREHLM